MLTKKMIACIYLYQKRAVAGIQDRSELSPDPVALAESYAEWKCDEILVYDLSEDDASHEEAIDLIREICSAVPIPVIGAGRIRRMEDVKKLLYAGCRQAVLDYDRPDNVELTREVSLKFGPNRLLARIGNERALEEAAVWLKDRVSGVLLTDISAMKTAVRISPVPVIVVPPDISLDKLMEILKLENVGGIAGKLVNENIHELEAIRKLSADGVASEEEETSAHEDECPVQGRLYLAGAEEKFRRHGSGHRPGLPDGCGADAGLHGRGSLRGHHTHRKNDLFQQKPRTALGEGRDQRTLPVCEIPVHRLRL